MNTGFFKHHQISQIEKILNKILPSIYIFSSKEKFSFYKFIYNKYTFLQSVLTSPMSSMLTLCLKDSHSEWMWAQSKLTKMLVTTRIKGRCLFYS